MPGFRLRLKGLKDIAFAGSIQEPRAVDISFRIEYLMDGCRNPVMVKPILVGSIIIFLVQFPGEEESMALVYNEKDAWSDIEKESTGLTEAIGKAIETYYSTAYTSRAARQSQTRPEGLFGDHQLN